MSIGILFLLHILRKGGEKSMEKREYLVGVRLNKTELDFLQTKALQEKQYCFRNGNANLPKYIRACVLDRAGWRMDSYAKELKNLTYQIRKIGVNINQVTAKINSGYYGSDAIRILQKNQKQIEHMLQNLLEEWEKENGSYKIDAYQAGETGRGHTSV